MLKEWKNPTIDQLSPEEFKYNRMGPWPQPCPAHPLGEAPSVIHLPLSERLDWWMNIGSRYMMTLAYAPIAYMQSLITPGVLNTSDQEFLDYLTNSMMAKFIVDEFDSTDRQVFKDFELVKNKHYIVDLQPVRVVKTFDGIYVSGTKTLFEQVGSDFVLKAIWVDKTETLFTPGEGDGWRLAKMFVLQGAALCATLVIHPLIHFPIDSINAITKTALPTWHPLFKLLYPHLRFTLPLENAVLTFKTSLLQAKWWMPYAPYPGEAKGLRELLVEGYRGIEGNVSYKKYKYPLVPPKVYFKYGEFQNAYYKVFYDFVSKITNGISSEDKLVKQWADFISKEVPGFPNGEEIFRGDTFVKAVASYLWQVTIGHSIDHYNYGYMDVRKVPLRLRQSPPKKGDKIISYNGLNKFWDAGKYRMAQILFFRPTTVTSLIQTQYDFSDPLSQECVDQFKQSLVTLDEKMRMEGKCFIPLDKIAASIQY